MARVKNGTRMSHISLMNVEVDSTWITNHYNGLLNTDDDNELDLRSNNSFLHDNVD
jgi:hypothetical protein